MLLPKQLKLPQRWRNKPLRQLLTLHLLVLQWLPARLEVHNQLPVLPHQLPHLPHKPRQLW
jgi:hypothetical protein